MDDFEPSDQLTTVLDSHETQAYQITVQQFPAIIKTVMALSNNEDPAPVIVKIQKKGSNLPIKDLRGKLEVLDVIEIIEEDDIGTYIVEFTNTSRYPQDMTFIIKQIGLERAADGSINTHKTVPSTVSSEEVRLYNILNEASADLKHF